MLFTCVDLGKTSVVSTLTKSVVAVKASMALPDSRTPTEMTTMLSSRSHDTSPDYSISSVVTLQAWRGWREESQFYTSSSMLMKTIERKARKSWSRGNWRKEMFRVNDSASVKSVAPFHQRNYTTQIKSHHRSLSRSRIWLAHWRRRCIIQSQLKISRHFRQNSKLLTQATLIPTLVILPNHNLKKRRKRESASLTTLSLRHSLNTATVLVETVLKDMQLIIISHVNPQKIRSLKTSLCQTPTIQ